MLVKGLIVALIRAEFQLARCRNRRLHRAVEWFRVQNTANSLIHSAARPHDDDVTQRDLVVS